MSRDEGGREDFVSELVEIAIRDVVARLKEGSWMCGCGRLILVESGTHSWTIIGLARCF